MRIINAAVAVTVLVLSLFISPVALAQCSPFDPSACVFKREDSKLAFIQPLEKWWKEEDFEKTVAAANNYVDQYMNTAKLSGDGAIRAMNQGRAAGLELVTTLNTAIMVVNTIQNDPWQLKNLYADIACDVFFTVVRALPVIEHDFGDCFGGFVAQGQELIAAYDALQRIRDMVNNPYLLLGYEWGDIASKVTMIRDELNEIETMAGNLTGAEMEQRLTTTFTSFDEKLIEGLTRGVYVNTRRNDIDRTVDATINDVMMASQATARSMSDAMVAGANPVPMITDTQRIADVSALNDVSVGRMQATEIRNLALIQGTEIWTELAELKRATGYMEGLDLKMELDLEQQNQAAAALLNSNIATPGEEIQILNGVPVGF